MWKNKIIWLFLLVFGIGIFITTQKEEQLPKDNTLSLGNSTVRVRMETIDNYANVMDYGYKFETSEIPQELRLRDLEYRFWEEIEFPKQHYLQGICYTDRYIFVSAYLDEEDSLGEIMVFCRDTGEYVITYGLDEDSHLGGIAFDGTDVWVCNSTNQTVERISYEVLCEMMERHQGEKVDITNLVTAYPVINTPSSITYYDGLLWIATHNKWINSTMVNYCYDAEKDVLCEKEIFRIPSKVQGLVFDENGELYVSCSYGRKKSSFLKEYSSVEVMTQDTSAYECIIEMPPCSEGIALYEDELYILFESAGEKYYAGTDGFGTSLSPLDQILILDKEILE